MNFDPFWGLVFINRIYCVWATIQKLSHETGRTVHKKQISWYHYIWKEKCSYSQEISDRPDWIHIMVPDFLSLIKDLKSSSSVGTKWATFKSTQWVPRGYKSNPTRCWRKPGSPMVGSITSSRGHYFSSFVSLPWEQATNISRDRHLRGNRIYKDGHCSSTSFALLLCLLMTLAQHVHWRTAWHLVEKRWDPEAES